jgi:hypothetical protein
MRDMTDTDVLLTVALTVILLFVFYAYFAYAGNPPYVPVDNWYEITPTAGAL